MSTPSPFPSPLPSSTSSSSPPPVSPQLGTAHLDTFVQDHLPPVSLQPDTLLDLPTLRFPPRLNCATELLDGPSGPADRAGRLAVLSPHGVRWTYAELLATVSRIAHVLTEDMGLVPGNRVLLRGANTPMLVAIWLAVVRAGGVVVATMPLLRAKELAYVIDKARITHALCESALGAELEAAEADGRPLRTMHFLDGARGDWDAKADPGADLETAMAEHSDWFPPVDTAATDPCLIAFTSGTTGMPKATVHSHRDVMAVCCSFPQHVLRATSDDRFIGTPSLAFTYGLGGLLLFPLHIGASVVLLDRASPQQLARAIDEFRATVCFSGPTAYRAMCMDPAPYGMSSLRECVSAGEPLPPVTRKMWKQATGHDLIDGLGSTEMLHIFIAMRGDEAATRPGALGRPVPGYLAAIVDDAGRPLPYGEVGALAVKGPTGCRYLDDDRQVDYVRNGWNLTGDACWADKDGYLHYHARLDDMIVSAGYNISPVEVEATLLTHPAVRECAAVAAPDDERGAVVQAHVVLAKGHAPSPELVLELQQFAKAEMAPYKYPRVIAFCDELPRAGTGKVQRFRLRGATADSSGPSAELEGVTGDPASA
ncbi:MULTISPECIES: AMP-binding protein [unclassified Streptomyces]|uniref:AMP-binding protein n=1 Tax=Streptomyces sp. NBC_00060 TaxID=2975636 RepID=A0AAU2GTR4_9ACTN